MKKILSLLLLVSLSAKGQNYFSDKIALSNAMYGVAATVVKERGASGSTAAALAMLSNEATSGYKTSRLIEELKREQLWDDCVFLQVFGRGQLRRLPRRRRLCEHHRANGVFEIETSAEITLYANGGGTVGVIQRFALPI